MFALRTAKVFLAQAQRGISGLSLSAKRQARPAAELDARGAA
jgi:hypothetical protein